MPPSESHPARSSASFSLRHLFVVTFVVAILVAVAKVVPAETLLRWPVVILVFAGFTGAGVAAARAKRSRQFWYAVAACLLTSVNPFITVYDFLSAMYWRGGWPWFFSGYRRWIDSVDGIVMFSCSVGMVLLLTFSALIRGHWSTRLLALPVLVYVLFELSVVLTSPLVSFGDTWEYWITGNPDDY